MIRAVSQRYRAAYSGLPREVWLLSVVLFINRSGMMVLPFLTLYLTENLQMGYAAAGRMLSVYGIGSIIGAYLGGRLSERFGAIRVQTLSMFLSVPLYLVVPYCSSWQQILIALFILAIVCEAVRPANATAIAQFTTKSQRTRAFALQRLAANLGFSIGPAMGGFIADYSFTLLFVIDALTTFTAACVLIYFFKMRRYETVVEEEQSLSNGHSPIKNLRFVIFLILMTITFGIFMQFLVTYPLYLQDHLGLSKKYIGRLYAVNTIMIVLFEMVLVDYTKRWPLLRIVGWGCGLVCIGFGMLPFGSSFSYCVLAMAIATIGEMLSFPGSAAYVANLSPKGYEGRYMGWYATTHSAAWILSPTIGAAVYAMNPNAFWLLAISMTVPMLLVFRWLEGTDKKYVTMASEEGKWE